MIDEKTINLRRGLMCIAVAAVLEETTDLMVHGELQRATTTLDETRETLSNYEVLPVYQQDMSQYIEAINNFRRQIANIQDELNRRTGANN